MEETAADLVEVAKGAGWVAESEAVKEVVATLAVAGMVGGREEGEAAAGKAVEEMVADLAVEEMAAAAGVVVDLVAAAKAAGTAEDWVEGLVEVGSAAEAMGQHTS